MPDLEISEIPECSGLCVSNKICVFSKMRFGDGIALVQARRAKRMTLKIQRSVEHRSAVFTLTGRIQAEHVPGLRALLIAEPPLRNVLIDLKFVKLVDRDAVRFLAQSEAAGAALRHCSAYIREWITQEKNAMDRKPEDPQDLADGGNTLCG